MRPRTGTPNAIMPKPTGTPTSVHENQHPPDQVREQVIARDIGRRDEPLGQLAPPRIDDGEAEPPDGVAHDAEADEAGHEEIDVPGSGLPHEHPVGAAAGSVRPAARCSASSASARAARPCGFVSSDSIDDRAVRAAFGERAPPGRREARRAGGMPRRHVSRRGPVLPQRCSERRAVATRSERPGPIRNAMPSPVVRRIGKNRIAQNTASGSRRNSRMPHRASAGRAGAPTKIRPLGR